ncbi:MAG: GPR endopeptidase, partial [Halanaerobiales bacterium]
MEKNEDITYTSGNVYTDLALEAHNLAVERSGRGEVHGVSLKEDSTENARVTRVEVLDQKGAEALGKPVGKYITIEADGLQGQNRLIHNDLSETLGRELENLINFAGIQTQREEPVVLVVGLGNWNATPDALGPHILDYLMVTRHLYDQSPPEVREGMRSVCALAPGVLGITGIQTA